MTTPCIITVAITGSVPRKSNNPNLPVSTEEQVESTHASYEAGASLVHIHVRDENEEPNHDVDRFAAVQEGIKKHCRGMIIQFSSSGHNQQTEHFTKIMKLGPDMISFTTGTINFRTRTYENKPAFIREFGKIMTELNVKPEIEIFDLHMLYTALDIMNEGVIRTPIHAQFVFGVKNTVPARRSILEFQLSELHELAPDATWTAAGVGRHQIEANHWALELGGHCRTGLEDNIRYDRHTLAKSNAQLVERVAGLCGRYDRHPASPEEARTILALESA